MYNSIKIRIVVHGDLAKHTLLWLVKLIYSKAKAVKNNFCVIKMCISFANCSMYAQSNSAPWFVFICLTWGKSQQTIANKSYIGPYLAPSAIDFLHRHILRCKLFLCHKTVQVQCTGSIHSAETLVVFYSGEQGQQIWLLIHNVWLRSLRQVYATYTGIPFLSLLFMQHTFFMTKISLCWDTIVLLGTSASNIWLQ